MRIYICSIVSYPTDTPLSEPLALGRTLGASPVRRGYVPPPWGLALDNADIVIVVWYAGVFVFAKLGQIFLTAKLLWRKINHLAFWQRRLETSATCGFA